MLRRLVKPAFNIVARTQARPVLTAVKPVFCFSNQVQAVSKLKNILDEEIKHQSQNKQDLTEFTNFFTNQGWKVAYDDVQVELSKKNGPYQLKILFNARTPMGDDINEEQNQGNAPQQQEQGQDQGPEDFSQVAAFIKKDGSSKWLSIDFMIANTNQVQFASATFITDYEQQKAERKKGRIPNSGYNGPQLSSLDEKLQQSLYGFVESVGLNGQVLQRAGQFSLAYEQQFYIQWLKDLKSLA